MQFSPLFVEQGIGKKPSHVDPYRGPKGGDYDVALIVGNFSSPPLRLRRLGDEIRVACGGFQEKLG